MFKKFLLVLFGFTLGELLTIRHINAVSDAVAETHGGTRHAILEVKGLEKFLHVQFNHQNHVYCKPSCKLR